MGSPRGLLVGALAWRSRQRGFIRWVLALSLFGTALTIRLAFGRLHGANPALTFYPAVLLACVLLGWEQAVAVLVLAVITGSFLFLPPGLYLQPIAWVVVGGLNIVIIAALEGTVRELTIANERHQILFQELQHRVANSLQAASGTIEIAKRHIAESPADVTAMLDEAAARIAASADVHRRLNDPNLFRRGLKLILRDAVFSIIDPNQVALILKIEEIDLSFEQMRNLTQLVIEATNNAQKHVYRRGMGSHLYVSLERKPGNRAILIVRDDGPGADSVVPSQDRGKGLGLRVIRGLTAQLSGKLTVNPNSGMELVLEFPLDHPR